MRKLFRVHAGRDWMRGSGFVVWLQVLPRPDIMGAPFGFPSDEGREVLAWATVEVRIPWPLFSIRAHSDAAEIRFREGVRKLVMEP